MHDFMEQVESSNLAAIGYVEETQHVYVRFKNKFTWRYKGVPRDLFEQFRAAPSKGVFFSAKIKNAFPGEKVIEADLMESGAL